MNTIKAGTCGMVRVSTDNGMLTVKKITRTSVIPLASVASITKVPGQVVITDNGGRRTVINAWRQSKVARFIEAARAGIGR